MNEAPRLALAAHEVEEEAHLVLGQRCRRLVEDDDAGVGEEGARDLDHLALGDGHVSSMRRVTSMSRPKRSRRSVASRRMLLPVDEAARSAWASGP